MAEPLHRFADDYWAQSEWKQMPEAARRIRRALGPEPLRDQRHRVPALVVAPQAKSLPPGPRPGTSLLIDIAAEEPLHRDLIQLALADRLLVECLEGVALWGFSQGEWFPLTRAPLRQAQTYHALTLAWERTSLPGSSLQEVTESAARCVTAAQALSHYLGARITRSEEPREAAQKTAQLVRLKQRFAHSVELRWLATNTPLSAGALWRTVYALGFGWGHLDLFYWPAAPQHPLFTLANLGKPGYFLPERVIEGEAVAGVTLSFELPACPAPRETFERMALALAAFGELLGGCATDSRGQELDGERLDAERSALADAVEQLQEAGIVPGSPEALSFF